jgi:hypothetical protein
LTAVDVRAWNLPGTDGIAILRLALDALLDYGIAAVGAQGRLSARQPA